MTPEEKLAYLNRQFRKALSEQIAARHKIADMSELMAELLPKIARVREQIAQVVEKPDFIDRERS